MASGAHVGVLAPVAQVFVVVSEIVARGGVVVGACKCGGICFTEREEAVPLVVFRVGDAIAVEVHFSGTGRCGGCAERMRWPPVVLYDFSLHFFHAMRAGTYRHRQEHGVVVEVGDVVGRYVQRGLGHAVGDVEVDIVGVAVEFHRELVVEVALGLVVGYDVFSEHEAVCDVAARHLSFCDGYVVAFYFHVGAPGTRVFPCLVAGGSSSGP